jgi:hypothetical protein
MEMTEDEEEAGRGESFEVFSLFLLTLCPDSQSQIQIRPGETGVVGKPGGNRNPDPCLRCALPSSQDLSVLPALGRVGQSGAVRGVSCPAPLLVGQQHIVAFFLRNRWRDGGG